MTRKRWTSARARLVCSALLTAAILISCAGANSSGDPGDGYGRAAGSNGPGDRDDDEDVDTGRDHDAIDPAARAAAGRWSAGDRPPPPHDCNDQGGTEWCDGHRDDDCDGVIDEGCVDCVTGDCFRYHITAEEVARGSGHDGPAECIGPIYCGLLDGFATTTPPGGCGDFHCGTLRWADGTAQPYHCTVYGRCVDGEFEAKGFSW